MPDEARDKLVTAIESSKTLSGSAKRKMIAQLTPRLETLFRKGMDSQAQIFSILQTSLAIPEASSLLNAWLQDMVKGTPTIYDKAMDAAYNSTRIGGGDHRLFDGGHTIAGAFQAVRNASPDDSIFEVFSQRYERGSILVTTNLPFDEWPEMFGSERLTGALLDRLTHHVHIIEMNGDSYRLRQSGRPASE